MTVFEKLSGLKHSVSASLWIKVGSFSSKCTRFALRSAKKHNEKALEVIDKVVDREFSKVRGKGVKTVKRES